MKMISLAFVALLRAPAATKAFRPAISVSPVRISAVTFATRAVAEPTFSTKLIEQYNKQVTNELTASQLYLSASLWCELHELPGMAKYFMAESEEERGHAMQFIEFANKRRLPVKLQTLEAPPSEWQDVQGIWESLLEYEQKNTKEIRTLADLADEENDRSLSSLLDPFHMEQVEEEDKMMKMIAKVRDQKQTPGLLRQLDTELEEKAKATA